MDFIDEIRALGTRIENMRRPPKSEEATKTAFVMPFIALLGYDIFNPNEVIPEFTADIGHKKGEKVDYAIFIEDNPIIFIECKTYGSDLATEYVSQLLRYFSTESKVRFGILTNGVQYRFFSDLDEPNKMDEKPFFEFDLLSFNETQVEELRRFTKSSFNLEDIISAAGELKYTREVERIMAEQIANPSEDFIKFFAWQIYPGKLMQSVLDRFHGIIKHALQQFINDRVNDRLKSALEQTEKGKEEPAKIGEVPKKTKTGITTSEEEIQAYLIVKAILHSIVEPKRVIMRDLKNFCAILLDDTIQQPICKLYFNNLKNKSLGLVDHEKNVEQVPIDELDDIYKYSDRLRETITFYENPTTDAETAPLRIENDVRS